MGAPAGAGRRPRRAARRPLPRRRAPDVRGRRARRAPGQGLPGLQGRPRGARGRIGRGPPGLGGNRHRNARAGGPADRRARAPPPAGRSGRGGALAAQRRGRALLPLPQQRRLSRLLRAGGDAAQGGLHPAAAAAGGPSVPGRPAPVPGRGGGGRHGAGGPRRMKLAIFGLTISSSWGNGHATLWRGLCRALAKNGHRVVFFEKDVPYYALHRDLRELPGTDLRLYASWEEVLPEARREVADADAAMVTSYCPDGVAASELVLSTGGPRSVFYDLDTPVTLERLKQGEAVPYLPVEGLGGFDLVLSYTGGRALDELRERLGARRVAPLYGSVDPEVHCPAEPSPGFQGDFSYLGTY